MKVTIIGENINFEPDNKNTISFVYADVDSMLNVFFERHPDFFPDFISVGMFCKNFDTIRCLEIFRKISEVLIVGNLSSDKINFLTEGVIRKLNIKGNLFDENIYNSLKNFLMSQGNRSLVLRGFYLGNVRNLIDILRDLVQTGGIEILDRVRFYGSFQPYEIKSVDREILNSLDMVKITGVQDFFD